MNDFVELIPLLKEAPTLVLLFFLWFQIRDIGKKVNGFQKVEIAVARLEATIAHYTERK